MPKCVTVEVYFLNRGYYQDSVVGPAVAASVGVSKQPFEVPSPDVVYVSDSADQTTTSAVKSLFSCAFGMSPGSDLRRAVFAISSSKGVQTIKLEGVLTLEVAPLERRETRLLAGDNPVAYSWIGAVRRLKAKRFQLSNELGKVEFAGTNALAGDLVSFMPKERETCGFATENVRKERLP